MANGGKTRKYYLATLGCPKNEIDSEALEMNLMSAGFESTDNPLSADLLLVNSCGFINDAKVETIQTVLDLHQSRKKGSILVLCGCLPVRYNLTRALNEVDIFLPWNKHHELIRRLQDMGWALTMPAAAKVSARERIKPVSPSAYLRISEGCDNRCAYCAIPDIKGPFTSRPIQEIVDEARYLCDNGVKELVIIGQDTTLYGFNSTFACRLPLLLEKLSKETDCEWIRLMYAHPAHLSDETIAALASNDKIVKYIDLPLQHINNEILQKMNRRVTRRRVEEIIGKLRNKIADIVIRTTFIVGFPGETDGQYEELLDFCEEIRFDNVGIFKYSLEEGTPAFEFGGRIDSNTAEERYLTLLDIQNMISAAKLSRRVNRRERALILERGPDGSGIGRGWFQAPEIDGQVIVNNCHARPGEFADVIIERTDAYDLFAREA